jgi:hypothetical protein
MQTINLRSWSKFEEAVRAVDHQRQKTKSGRVLKPVLFRGVGNSKWSLETTLERAHPSECCQPASSLIEYYQRISASKPVIETLRGKRIGRIPTFPEFERLVQHDSYGGLDVLMMQQPGVWEYLVYLRHHGFPSPLLDWTASPYVAAFFAFDSPPKHARRVCVYALLQDVIHSISADAHLFVIGQYMKSHPRHFLQQCRYTMCVGRESGKGDYVFRPHQSGLEDAIGPEGRMLAITIPMVERVNALKQLERMNINAFSLFGSEDSLIRTVARRELLLRNEPPNA